MRRQSEFIRVSELQKVFRMGENTVYALAGIDLTVESGSFSLVMGPSGSGKSTLLYLLGGLDRPTAGNMIVNGNSLEHLDENDLAVYRRATVGFIFQSFNLVASMTARENVEYPLWFAGVNPSKRKQIALERLDQVGLSNRAHHKPTELSGGQQQRVAIARALVNNPPLILADEPTGNLDTGSGASIMELLSELHQQGKTVLVVSHDSRMEQYATSTLHLLDGRIQSLKNHQRSTTSVGSSIAG